MAKTHRGHSRESSSRVSPGVAREKDPGTCRVRPIVPRDKDVGTTSTLQIVMSPENQATFVAVRNIFNLPLEDEVRVRSFDSPLKGGISGRPLEQSLSMLRRSKRCHKTSLPLTQSCNVSPSGHTSLEE